MFDSWHTVNSSITTSVLFEITISGRDASWNISFIEPNVDDGRIHVQCLIFGDVGS